MNLFIRISTLLLMMPQALWAEDLTTAAKMGILDKAITAFEKECLSNGSIKSDPAWCAEQQAELQRDLAQVTAEIDSTPVPDVSILADEDCIRQDDKRELAGNVSDAVITAAMDDLFAGEEPCKAKENTKPFSVQCLGEVAQNINRSATSSMAEQSNCARELAHGIVEDVIISVKGLLVDLPQLIGQGVAFGYRKSAEAAKAFWDRVWKAEDVTSNTLLFASSADPRTLKEWIQDTSSFAKNLAIAMSDMLNKYIKETYGCEKWSGTPYTSKCEKPMRAWDCASCSQRMNAICGVIGLLAGEIAAAYLTGGMAAVVKILGTHTGVGAKTVSAVAKQHFPGASSQASKALLKSKAAARLSAAGAKKTYDKLIKRPAVQVIQAGAKIGAPKLNSVLKSVGSGSVTVVRYGTYPVGQYLNVMNKAAALGYRQAGQIQILNRSQGAVHTVTYNPATIQEGDVLTLSGHQSVPSKQRIEADGKVLELHKIGPNQLVVRTISSK